LAGHCMQAAAAAVPASVVRLPAAVRCHWWFVPVRSEMIEAW
jgi:hypothetical protein